LSQKDPPPLGKEFDAIKDVVEILKPFYDDQRIRIIEYARSYFDMDFASDKHTRLVEEIGGVVGEAIARIKGLPTEGDEEGEGDGWKKGKIPDGI